MKKCFMLLAAALLTMSMSAKDLTGIKFYVNPGHGSFGPNDRPMATIPYPNLPTTGMPDTCGFYESNTNMWKCLYLGAKLEAMGAEVMYSHTECGPWPYTMVNGDYPDYTYNKGGSIQGDEWQPSDGYYCHPDIEKYNRDLVEITEEVEANNIDYFISVHSNANTDGSTANFPLMLYRGPDSYTTANSVDGYEYVEGSYEKAKFCNEERLKIMKAGIDVASSTKLNIRGDWNFYSSHSDRTHANGKKYSGYLGVLKHGASGFLSEGYFHTYQPARHRALNQDYCHMEGLDYYRGIINYYGADKETVGYIVGTVKDQYNKMSHSLYTYTPKSNDQWVPCNGAEVILKKGGVEVARYNVDTMYNGIFVFAGLEPGDDYSLDANCDGFFPLADQYKVPFSVKANETTYPMIYLVDTTWTPPTIVYEDYPNPNQPAYLGLPSVFEMKQEEAIRDYTEVIKGTVKRTLQSGDSTIILSHDSAGIAHIYIIKSSLNTIDTISTVGITPVDPENAGDYLALSDIALTCDGKLVGVNYIRCQYGADQVDAGYKRGVKTFYIWDALAGDPRVWFTANDAANSYRSDAGYTLAVKGESKDCQVIVSSRHYNATTGGALRISAYAVTDGIPSYIFYGNTLNASAPLHAVTHGEDLQFTLSPRGEKKDFIFDAGLTTPMEFRLPGGQNQDVTILGTIPAELMHVKFNGATYFIYAGKALMAAPTTDAEGKVTGVQVLDITDGLDKAVVIKTTNTTLAEPVEATYAAATAKVVGADLNLYLLVDGKIYTFTTVGVAQPVVAHIMALNLNVTETEEAYTFTFDATADAKAANLVFYNKGNLVAGKVAISATKGANTVTVAKAEIPGKPGQTLTWAVELEGETIANWGRIHHTPLANLKADASTAMVRPFISINNNPESDYFQYLYVMDRQGSGNAKSGLHAFTPDYKQINTAPLKGGRDMYGSPYRSFVDDQGYIWISDGRDATSGIIVADPANLEGTYEEFFIFDNRLTTTDYAGLLTNNGVDVGSSSVGLSVYGTGKDAKLLTINEDAGTWLKHMSLVIYNIGTEEGTYQHSWDSLPSAQIELKGMAAIDGYPLGCSHGVWIATNRSAGNNNASATALQFYDWEGTRQLSSAEAPYKDLIDGCAGGACALNEDESVLYMIDGSQNLLVWDIVWEGNKPVMTLRYSYKCGMSSIREMHLDYAGNLVCSGDKGTGIVVFTVPSEENVTLVPAKKALTVTCPGTAVPVTGVALDTAAVELIVEDTHTLTAIITPEDATDNYVKWTTSDAKIATVNEGVVTAVAVGTATITVTTVDGGYTATCQVTVKPRPVTGVTLDKAEATIEVKETITLLATVAPANATNKDVTWTSDNAAVATVVDGVVTAVAEGSANITVTTVDGAFTATCKVTVNPISVKGVALSQAEANLKVEETVALQAIFTPADAANQNVTWATSDAQIATVENGVVTAVALGTATITVTTEDGGFTATCMITVVPTPVTGVTLDFTELALEVPASATLTAIVAPEDATDKSLTWASDNEDVAIVADGVVTAIDAGTANITVTTVDGNFTATCVVTVSVASGVLNIHALDVNAPMYDVLGRQVDKTYRGIVIQNGQAFLLR